MTSEQPTTRCSPILATGYRVFIAMSSLDSVRDEFRRLCIATQESSFHSATFQPLDERPNQDRHTTQQWDIMGQTWTFLAVCDGHSGSYFTAEYTITSLPNRLRKTLCTLIDQQLHGETDRDTLVRNTELICSTLGNEVEQFDAELGAEIRAICPEPEKLNEDESKDLVDKHLEVIRRAYSGTTFVAALVNVSQRCMWVFNTGDSTAGISTQTSDGRRDWVRLSVDHIMSTPQEYFRVSMAHPYSEHNDVTRNNAVLGNLGMTRSIGDYYMKLPPSYITHLFTFLPGDPTYHPDPKYIKTPPYTIAKPSTRFFDLEPVWDAKPMVFVFSDGIDHVVEHYSADVPNIKYPIDTGRLVAQLLGDDRDRREVAAFLGHPVEPGWNQDGNKAVEVIGNLFGGANAERIQAATIQASWDGDEWPEFYIDDTTLVVYTLFD
ncbi:protein serine/threonine phosphatase 2C [Lenzites betulinus]|nr:protein serine/threonine phosphatase 2C [Lenzites betulinus]